MAGQSITTGTTFNVSLPPYSMTWLRIPITTGMHPINRVKEQSDGVMIRQVGRHTLAVTSSLSNSHNYPWSFAVFGIDGRQIASWSGTGNSGALDLGSAMSGVVICRSIIEGKEYAETFVMK
jgi:hypothetical protein